MQAAVLSMAINIFLNAVFVFVFELGAVSIALSTSFSAWFNCWFLQRALKQQKWLNFDACKGALCALASGAITLLLGHFLIQDPAISILLQKTSVVFPRTFVEQALNFFVLSGTFCLTFLSYAWLFDVHDVLSFFRIPSRKSV